MKILAISAYYPPDTVGGYEWAAYEVLTRLRNRGHDVKILAAKPDRPCPSDENISRTLTRMHPPADNAFGRFASKIQAAIAYIHNYREIRRAIEKHSPDVIYMWAGAMLTPAVIAAIEGIGIKTVFHLEDMWIAKLMEQESGNSVLSRLSRGLRSMFAKLPEFKSEEWVFVQVSDALAAQYAAAGIIPAKTVRVHNGYEPASAPREWEAEPDVYEIGFSGRIHPTKGLEVLFKAFAIIKQKCTSRVHLSIFGKGNVAYEKELKEMADRLGLSEMIRWHGALPRAKLLEKYKTLDLLAIPSTWEEPFGLVAIEALAAGVPVVAAARGGLREIVNDKVGWLVEPEAETFAAAIAEAITDYDRLALKGKNGPLWISENFGWKDKVETIEKLLSDYAR
ncbi:MAG: glycosyltransferase family 4 protein [Planctomycetes bacterium]|nr:glycosyltransferase family 4 protein [Planctomycetota bacterium]